MKKYFVISNLILLFSPASFSQKNPSATLDKSVAASNKDTAYQRFRSELHKLINKAKGRNTFAAEAKQLFQRNQALLNRVNNQYHRSIMMTRAKPLKAKTYRVDPSIAKWSFGMQSKTTKSMAPYQAFHYVELANAGTLALEHEDLAAGEVFYHVMETTSNWAPSFKEAHTGFTAYAKVPDDPSIIAARVKIEYSFYYTGWDTYGSNNGIELIFGPDKKFRSPVLDAAVDSFAYSPGHNFCNCKYTVIDILKPMDSITTSIQEVHASKEGSFTVDGYVKPNDQLDFNIGAGYMRGSVYGFNGQYLYGEFRLKKATITWLKTAN